MGLGARMSGLLNAQLEPGEAIRASLLGRYTTGEVVGANVAMALTDRRVVAVVKHLTRTTTLSWAFHEINSVGTTKGIGSASLAFSVPGSTFVCERLAKADADAFRREVEQAIAAAAPGAHPRPEAPAAGSPAPTTAQRLARLEALLADGVITRAEHDAKRAAILDEL